MFFQHWQVAMLIRGVGFEQCYQVRGMLRFILCLCQPGPLIECCQVDRLDWIDIWVRSALFEGCLGPFQELCIYHMCACVWTQCTHAFEEM